MGTGVRGTPPASEDVSESEGSDGCWSSGVGGHVVCGLAFGLCMIARVFAPGRALGAVLLPSVMSRVKACRFAPVKVLWSRLLPPVMSWSTSFALTTACSFSLVMPEPQEPLSK